MLGGFGSGNNGGSGRPKPQGIHHANIRDQKGAARRLKASFRRVGFIAEFEKDKRKTQCFVVLMEMTPGSTYAFFSERVPRNATLRLFITEPLTIDVRARVRYSEVADRNGSQNRKATSNSYRTLLEFLISSDSERDALMDLYQQIRDENYVATKWHHYISERAQLEAKAKANEIRFAEKMREANDTPDLASPEMIKENPEAAAEKVSAANGPEATANNAQSDSAVIEQEPEAEGGEPKAA